MVSSHCSFSSKNLGLSEHAYAATKQRMGKAMLIVRENLIWIVGAADGGGWNERGK